MPTRSSFEATAGELYALHPSEFTAARNARIREARNAGGGELATALGGLHKPTTAAWLVNLLVRERRDAVEHLLDLGGELRKAQADLDGDALRRISRARHDAVRTLTSDARLLGSERGERAVSQAVVRELEGTLEAASADEDAAEELRRGRLEGALAYSGLGFGSPAEAQSGARRSRGAAERGRSQAGRVPSTRPTARKPESARRRAQRGAREARTAADGAAASLSAAERASERARADLAAAEAELARRREAAHRAERVAREARAARDAAERTARRAEQQLPAATRDDLV